MSKSIPSHFNENFHNLDRNEKFEKNLKKSLELIEFGKENGIDNYLELTYLMGFVASQIIEQP